MQNQTLFVSLVEYFSCILFDTNRIFSCFSPTPQTDRPPFYPVASDFLSGVLVSTLLLLIRLSPLQSVSVAVWEADPCVPRLCRRTKELLMPMDFSFVDALGSMSCFCLPRRRPWIGISFHRYSSLLVSLCVYVHLNLCVLFLSLSHFF